MQRLSGRGIGLPVYDHQPAKKLIHSTNFHPNSSYTIICMTA
ncbi:hypothetical protein yinte0001_10360 [Yersinia intermedia ATCC 29909]|nr:hypothetical protein yinte0001_10360 [Yersinia intermedia ATCC 29909]